MNNSGSMSLNGTDLILLIIAVFLTLLFTFVGYHCCRRRQSSGKRKALQRQIKKGSSKRSQKTGQLLKGASANFEELNQNKKDFELVQGHSEDKKVIPSSSSTSPRNTKKSSKHHPASTSPKVDEKNINSGDYKRPNTPIFAGVWRALLRRGDIESGQNSTQETFLITSSVNKKMDKSSNFNKESSSKKKSQRKPESNIELSHMPSTRNQKTSPSHTDGRHADLFADTNSMEKSGKNNYKSCAKRSSKEHCISCTGSDCKKCKPHRETMSEANETVKKEERVSHQEDSSKELKVWRHNEYSASKEDTARDTSPSEDVVMLDNDEKTTDDDTPEPHTSSPAHSMGNKGIETYVLLAQTNKKITDDPQAFENTPSLRPDPQPLDEDSYEEIKAPTADTFEHIYDKKEALHAEVPHENRIESVGNVYDVVEYASQEWKGDTTKAEAIRKGYFEVPKKLGLHTLRVVRGDNYCAIRATLFQALAKNIPILQQFGEIQNIPQNLVSQGHEWIMQWNFGARFQVQRNKVCERMEECLKELYDLVILSRKMVNEEGRVSHLLSSLNYKHKDFDLRLMEAVKFLMLTSAIELHESLSSGKDVPVFAMIIFARDTSPDPYLFMKRHLNAVGDTGGLEQVEMFLLGYTLGLTIEVVRPSHFGKPDFIASYPDDMPAQTPTVTLIAEDDRHYNILS